MHDEIDASPETAARERHRYLLMVQAQQLREAATRTCLRGDRAALLGTALTLEAMARGVHEGIALSIPGH